MRAIWIKRAAWVFVVVLGLAGAVWFAWPQPIPVDLAAVARGAMEVTVDDDGKTEVRHVTAKPNPWKRQNDRPADRQIHYPAIVSP